MLSTDDARDIAERLVERAIGEGADAADAVYIGQRSSSVQVRLGELENVHRSEGEQLGLRLFIGARSASVATSDFSEESLSELARRCAEMARQAPEDPFAGLAPQDMLHRGELPALDADDGRDPEPAQLRARAHAAEQAALAVPGVTNSSGGSAGASASIISLATSHGFSGAYRASGHSCSSGVIAGEGSAMQRDHAWHSARHLEDLDDPESVGRLAGERAVSRLNPSRPKPGRVAVLFDPRVSQTLLGHFVGAINGAAVARKSSFLQDRLGEPIFTPAVSIVDDPLRSRGLRSRPFDGEGLPVTRTDLVSGGILRTWIAASAAARQLGIMPTGHASRGASGAPGAGPSNLYMAAGPRAREQLLAAVPQAILITELIGQGVNSVTGDYSRGAAGFMVRGGEIAEPVAEITIASNLVDMFATLEPASDLELRRGMDAPTLLVPEMTVAAA